MAYNDITNGSAFFGNRGKGPKKPKRTFTEMAEEFGVTQYALKAAMKDIDAPSPSIVCKNTRTCTNSYYDPDEMRKWWKTRSKQQTPQVSQVTLQNAEVAKLPVGR